MDIVSREQATTIEWVAIGPYSSKGTPKARGATAKEAVAAFLKAHKSRSFQVMEYRDGRHITVISFVTDHFAPRGMETISFKTRAEAQAFLDK